MPMILCAWLFGAGVIAGAPAAQAPPARFQSSQLQMGTSIGIILYATDETAANRGFQAAFARIRQLDKTLSDYDSDSEVSRLCRMAPTPAPVPVSEDLWRVLFEAQTLSRKTDGAFDVTVGPLSKLWRRAIRRRKRPSPQRLRAARDAVGYRNVRLDCQRRTVQLMRPAMRLDFGGIAKGYAADEALATLRKLGLPRALVNAGGDIAAGDPPPGRPGWKIGLARLDPRKPPQRFLALANGAVATSGDAWQFVVIDGVRYSHIIDPRTGSALTTRSTVSVAAPDCITADSLASAVCVLGPARGIQLVEDTPGAAALVVLAKDKEVHVVQSKRLAELAWPSAATTNGTPMTTRP